MPVKPLHLGQLDPAFSSRFGPDPGFCQGDGSTSQRRLQISCRSKLSGYTPSKRGVEGAKERVLANKSVGKAPTEPKQE